MLLSSSHTSVQDEIKGPDALDNNGYGINAVLEIGGLRRQGVHPVARGEPNEMEQIRVGAFVEQDGRAAASDAAAYSASPTERMASPSDLAKSPSLK